MIILLRAGAGGQVPFRVGQQHERGACGQHPFGQELGALDVADQRRELALLQYCDQPILRRFKSNRDIGSARPTCSQQPDAGIDAARGKDSDPGEKARVRSPARAAGQHLGDSSGPVREFAVREFHSLEGNRQTRGIAQALSIDRVRKVEPQGICPVSYL